MKTYFKDRLWWIKKHKGLVHELNSWSDFERVYTANESCIFLVATVEDEFNKTLEKVVGCTGLHGADDADYTKVVLERRLSPNTLAVSVRIFVYFTDARFTYIH